MKKLLLSALLAVSAVALVNNVNAARNHIKESGCICKKATKNCAQKPVCVKLVEAFEPACENVVCDKTFTCPVGTTARFDDKNEGL